MIIEEMIFHTFSENPPHSQFISVDPSHVPTSIFVGEIYVNIHHKESVYRQRAIQLFRVYTEMYMKWLFPANSIKYKNRSKKYTKC